MLRPGQVVILCAIALLTIGVVMVNSAGMAVRPLVPGAEVVAGITPRSIILSRATAYMCLAILALFAVSSLPVRRMAGGLENKLWTPPIGDHGWLLVGAGLIVIILSTVYWPVIGKQVNGAHRWVNLHLPGLESVQPSELAKWMMIPLIAWYGARLGRPPPDPDGPPPRLTHFWSGLIPALCVVGAISVFIVLEDLGTGFLVAIVACLVLLAAGARIWHFALFVPVGVAGVAMAIIQSPYRVRRITSFLDPFADPQGDGYHMIQSMATVSGGGVFGRGLGHGLQKFGYLPEDTTDFLYAVICEELGLAGAALVLGLYAILIWTIVGIVRQESSRLLKLAALGVGATIALQACINLVVVTGLAPTKGIALPLLSAGGTGWILTGAMLGLIVAIDRPVVITEVIEEDEEEFVWVDDEEEEVEAEPEPEQPPEVVVPRRVKPRVRVVPVAQRRSEKTPQRAATVRERSS